MKRPLTARSLSRCSGVILASMLGACASAPHTQTASDASSGAGFSRDAHYLAQLDENRFQTKMRHDRILAVYEAQIAEAPADADSFRRDALRGLERQLEDSQREHEDRADRILQNWILEVE